MTRRPPWVAYPQRKGAKKYYPVVRVTGELHDRICAAVLAEFEKMQTEFAPIPRQPAEDDVPF